ncbi:DUF2934 domain-containing protein [Terrihabitans sp. B22-R8]|uniref:DUF2934 domain-containing protein n=1 Tax=Terrihabitans sp. B22-R8 TaxID=3425128 RepID=UPI00403C6145
MDKDELIRQRAYEIWVAQGQPEGQESEHWAQARREIESESPPEPDANGPTGAEIPSSLSEAPPKQPKGEELKKATELG